MKLKHAALSAALVLFAAQAARAGETMGNAALSLAQIISLHSPLLGGAQKTTFKAMYEGKAVPGAAIHLNADLIKCHSSNVDVMEHDCELRFGNKTVHILGRLAHELDATLREAGVQSEGGAGSNWTQATHLKCVIDPKEVGERDGGGASCKWDEDIAQ